jgi:hypothetical protein
MVKEYTDMTKPLTTLDTPPIARLKGTFMTTDREKRIIIAALMYYAQKCRYAAENQPENPSMAADALREIAKISDNLARRYIGDWLFYRKNNPEQTLWASSDEEFRKIYEVDDQ